MNERMLLEQVIREDLGRKSVLEAKYICEESSFDEVSDFLKENFTLENLSLNELKKFSIILETYATIIETRNIYSYLSETINPAYQTKVEECVMMEADPKGGIMSWAKSLPQKAWSGVQRQSWIPNTQASKVKGANKEITNAQSEIDQLSKELEVAKQRLQKAQQTSSIETQKHQVNLPGSDKFKGQGPSFKQGVLRTTAKPLNWVGKGGQKLSTKADSVAPPPGPAAPPPPGPAAPPPPGPAAPPPPGPAAPPPSASKKTIDDLDPDQKAYLDKLQVNVNNGGSIEKLRKAYAEFGLEMPPSSSAPPPSSSRFSKDPTTGRFRGKSRPVS